MSKKILIVDDEQDIVEILKAILEHEKFEVSVAHNGEEGLEQARSYRPDLIITDIMMPKMDGYQFAENLKKDGSTKDIPIIMLTAKDQPADRYKGLSLGIVAYIVKLFDLDELTATVKEVLSCEPKPAQ